MLLLSQAGTRRSRDSKRRSGRGTGERRAHHSRERAEEGGRCLTSECGKPRGVASSRSAWSRSWACPHGGAWDNFGEVFKAGGLGHGGGGVPTPQLDGGGGGAPRPEHRRDVGLGGSKWNTVVRGKPFRLLGCMDQGCVEEAPWVMRKYLQDPSELSESRP